MTDVLSLTDAYGPAPVAPTQPGGTLPLAQAYGPEAPAAGAPEAQHWPGVGINAGKEDVVEPKEPTESKPTNLGRMILMDRENEVNAGMQGVTPNIAAHKKNYIGDVSAIRDDGGTYYDVDGKSTPTDPKKHVVLLDPEDQKYKVYARTPDVEEGPVMGKLLTLGRFLNFANATSAPGQLAGGTKAGAVAKAAVDQGIKLPEAISSPNTAARSRASVLSRIPWVGSNLNEAASSIPPQIEDKLSKTATALSPGGEVAGPAEAGANFKESVGDWMKNTSSGKIDKAYNALDGVIDPKVKIRMDRTWDAVTPIIDKYKAANIPDQSAAVKQIFDTISKPGGLDYNTLKFVRTRIGKMIQNPGELSGGMTEAELKQIYGGLTEDLGRLVQKAGGDRGTQLWNRANAYAKGINDRRRLLDDAFGNTSKSDEGLFGQVIKYAGTKDTANIRALSNAKKALPADDWQELGASVIQKLGHKVTPNGRVFDPTTFAKEYGGLSEEGKSVLFGSKGGDYRKSLDDIATISSRWGDAAKMASEAKGHGVGGVGLGGAILAAEGAKEVIHMLPEWASPAMVLPAVMGAKRYASYLANPASARAVARWMRTYENVQLHPGSNTVAAYHNASQALGNSIEADVKGGSPGWASRYLSGIAQAARESGNGE